MQTKGSDKENLVTVMQIAKMYWILSTWIFLSCLNSFSIKSLAACLYMSLADVILERFLPDQINSILGYRRLSCFAHSLQLVVSKFDECSDTIKKA